MSAPRFLQIHTLHSYTAALLNRDDTGQAKRLLYGGVSRTRISSQCLKRHWRTVKADPHALQTLAGFVDGFRSRLLIDEKVIKPLHEKNYPAAVIDALKPWFQWIIYSGKKDKMPKKLGEKEKADDIKQRPVLLFGEPELKWLSAQFEKLAKEAGDKPQKAFDAAANWADKYKDTAKLWREENNRLPAGLVSALFGRMVTSDPEANIEAPVYVAHAFTVHAAETEGDYFTAVEDLKRDQDDAGAGTIQESELTCGLFYGYVVIDMPGLIRNCAGDAQLAARVVHNLVFLIAEVSPGAKLGSTAPFGRADLMLIEAGDRQPRSLATAFRKALRPDAAEAVAALASELADFDEAYATGEARAHLCRRGEVPGIVKLPLGPLAQWAADKVGEAPRD